MKGPDQTSHRVPAKLPYHKPRFQDYGNITQLTGSDALPQAVNTDAVTGWGDSSTSGVS